VKAASPPPLPHPARAASPDSPPPSAPARRWGLWLLVGWLVQAGIRVALAAGQTIPVANPDETGYLFAARLLTGGPAADISHSTPYRGGYPLLLLPAFWLADDPVTVYRIVMVINALVGALLLVALFVLLRRLGLSGPWAYGAAHAVALLPAAVFFTQYALTDAILPVVLLGWLLLTHSWLTADPGSAGPVRVALHGAGAGLLAGYAYATHSRGTVVLAVHLVLVLVAVVARWRPWWSAAVGAAAAGGVALAGGALNGWIWPRLYPRGSYEMGAMLLERITTPSGYGWTIPVGLGQIWYLVVGTWGLAGIGLAAVLGVAVRRGAAPQVRALACAVLATVAGIAFATAAALPDEQRIANHAYGRYLACLAPTLVAVGVAVLLTAARRTVAAAGAATAAVTAALAVLIEWRAGGKFAGYVHFPFDFPETGFLTWTWDGFHLWAATLAGLALLGLAIAAALRGRRGAVALVCGLLVVDLAASAAAAWNISRPFVRQMAAAADLSGPVGPAGSRPRVAIDGAIEWKIWVIQLYLVSWEEVTFFDVRQGPPAEAELVLFRWEPGTPAERTWPGGAPPGWRVVDSRRTVEGDWVAWRR